MGLDIQLANFLVGCALALITLLAVGVALFKENLLKFANKPIIKIRFDDIYLKGLTMLLRLKVINQGKTLAKKCRVKIISVIVENGNTKDSLIDETDILKWSSAPKDMRYQNKETYGLVPIYREHKDITPQGGWEFCDLFEISDREKRVVFISSGRRNFLAEDENYIATIEISGDNLKPIRKEIKFSVPYKVNWESTLLS